MKVGDLVKLKSGSKPMVLTGDEIGGLVSCIWFNFDECYIVQDKYVPLIALRLMTQYEKETEGLLV